MNREMLIKVLKVGIGSSIAIAAAQLLGLAYASSAGIITLLTIQNTKKATLKLAITRTVSFLITIGLIAVLQPFGLHPIVAYGIYMALMVAINYKIGWPEVISVNATVGGQALIMEPQLSWSFIGNEAALVGSGLLIAILLNLKMPDKKHEIQQDIADIEAALKDLLHSFALHLHKKEKLKKDRQHISELITYIDRILDKAFENRDNTLKDHSRYFIEYLMMRRNQCIVLIHFYREVSSLKEIPDQADAVGEFLLMMSRQFNVRNNAGYRLKQLAELDSQLKRLELPKTAAEFEGRAALHQIIKELEEFLRLKNQFLEGVTQEQLSLYW